ncbi:microfibrillar-associated protein 5 isoform X2 [Elgaria multicarinata webbii]|uniref:microfibrillar-associated protein 5 isoform X2 n=1 Tax=Elgaria multicarinata webbii TaxID=159646 RepID=UPI002FCCE480
MMGCGAQMLLCLTALAVLSSDWLLPVVNAQDVPEDPTAVPDAEVPTDAKDLGDGDLTTASGCHEEKFPCTRLYSVHKPVQQCISYLCVTSLRRTYMINKEICSRIVCKEDEAMQDEICRQLAGLPPRRLRRSGQPRGPLCRRAQAQQQQTIEAQ